MTKKLQFLERLIAWVGLVLTLACLSLVVRGIQQDDELKEVRIELKEVRIELKEQKAINKRQEVIINKLNQEYQMKHYKK